MKVLEMPRQSFALPVALLFLSTAHVGIASDCKQAVTRVERLICDRDTGLTFLDDLLNSEYKSALRRTDTPEMLRASQRSWLKAKRDSCSNARCLRRVYVDRIAEISKSHTDAIEGVYLTNGACVTEPWRDENGDFIGKDCNPSPINYLKIERISEGQYRVTSSVSQFATGNFGCDADAYMTQKGNTLHLGKWVDENGLDPRCPFSIKIRPDVFEFGTNNEQCGLCGQNGNFDGEVFPRKSNAK